MVAKKQAPCKGPCRKQNEYRIENDVVYVRVGSNGEEMLCDKDDWSKMSGRVWRLDPGGYARAGRFGSFTRKAIKCPNGMQVDHINRNRLDNRKSNLRIVSQFENSLNKKLRIENISGMTGVTWDNLESRWRVQVTKDGHSNWIGRFRDLSEAKEARIRGEIQYFGRVISEC